MIKEMCAEHGVTCVYTSKLFFDRFTSSVTIAFPENLRKDHEEARLNINKQHKGSRNSQELSRDLKNEDVAYAKLRSDYVNQLWDRFSGSIPDDAEYRMNRASVTFYHDNPANLAPLIRDMKDSIVKVTIPRNETEIAFLRANTDKIIQDKYYLDNYPFRMVFKTGHNDWLTNYIVDQFGDKIDGQPIIDNTRVYYYLSNNQPTLYLVDFTDVVLTQIGAGDIVDKVIEVVLRK